MCIQQKQGLREKSSFMTWWNNTGMELECELYIIACDDRNEGVGE